MKCPECGFEINDNARFCEECGAKIPQEKQCPNCHAKAAPNAKFCMECGFRFGGNAPAAPNACVSIGSKNVIAGDVTGGASPAGASAGEKPSASISMGDKNVIAGDVIGEKYSFSGGATFIKNEDETRKLVQCHVCGQNKAISESVKCPRCGETVCESCYDRSVLLCPKCKEAEYRSALQSTMINGRIPLDKRIALDKLVGTLNLNPEKAKTIEQSLRNAMIGSKAAADDPKRRLILHSLKKAEDLLFDRSDPASAYKLLKTLHENDPYQEDILVDYIAAALEASPEEANGLLHKINADILGVELIRFDLALAGRDVLAAVDLLNKADAIWSGSVLLECRKVLVRKAMYDKTGDRIWLDEANQILSSLHDPETKMERSWVEKAKRALGYDLPEPTPAYCAEHDLFYFLLNSGSDAYYRLALSHEQDEAEYARLILLAAKSPSPSADALKRAAECLNSGKGTKQNIEEAMRLCRAAAERGDAEMQCKLGTCFYNGEGMDKDYAEAAKWFRKAAEQGIAEAQNSLGECYRDGEGVEKDSAEAAKWFRMAAEQGVCRGAIRTWRVLLLGTWCGKRQ